jgi:hypothetical protein
MSWARWAKLRGVPVRFKKTPYVPMPPLPKWIPEKQEPKPIVKPRKIRQRKHCLGQDCKSFVTGKTKYCKHCAKSQKRASNAASMRKRRSRVRKTGFSPLRAEALTSRK